MRFAFQKEYPQIVVQTVQFLERKKTFMKQTTEKIIIIDQVDNEGPKTGHSQWKLIYLSLYEASASIFKVKSTTLGDNLEVGDGEEGDDPQVFDLRRQRG